jgi:hypothetical protein
LNPEELEPILESLKEARKFADPASPQPQRLMAASGALPLPPTQISTVLYVLSHDSDEPVRTKATASLAALPERVLDATLAGEVPPGLLGVLAELHIESPDRLEKIALNPRTSDRTFCKLARLSHPRIVDIVSHNQTRLLRCSELVEALGDNPATSAATLDRVLEFLGLRGGNPAGTTASVEMPEPAPGTNDLGGKSVDPNSTAGVPADLLDGVPEEKVQRNPSLTVRLGAMKITQKIKLARFGNAETRAILVRDRNKLVAASVMNSPKLGESEVMAFVKNKSMSEDVIRIVANSREWTKSRAIQYQLCYHPKTPLGCSVKFLANFTDTELKSIAKSKEVADELIAQARRMIAKKAKQS